MTIIVSIISFFVSAFALKLALSALGQPAHANKYDTAVTVSGVLSLCGWVLGFVPFLGWFVYGVLWLAMVRNTYEISLKKSFGVAVLLVLIRAALLFALGFIL